MARWLYRLGSWSARRAWVVVLVWGALLGGGATSAVTLSQPFTSKMSIPGTEFQAVIDDLQQSLPKASGGSGSVVFSTTNGKPFTTAQERAIGAVVKRWKAADGVETATNPFTTEKKLDDARMDVADGKSDLADGKAKIKKNTRKLADAKDDIAEGRRTVAKNADKLADGLTKLEDAQKKLDAGGRKLSRGAATIVRNEKKLKAARAQLVSGCAQLDAALAAQGLTQKSVPVARARLEAAIDQLQQELDALIDQNGEADPHVATLRQQIAGYREQVAQLKTVEGKIAQIAAGLAQVDAGFDALNKGKAKLSAARKQLTAGQATIDANRARIAEGKLKLADANHTLNKAAGKVATGEHKLAKGERKLLDGEADLVRGQRQLALTEGLRFVSDDGTVAVTQVQFSLPSDEVSAATRAVIPTTAATLADEGVQVDYSKEVQGNVFAFGSEAVGVGVAAVVLLIMLGSLLAAGLPLLTALVGVGAGLLGVLTLTYWVQMTEITPILALMLGLAVGIDYALFLVNRHRHQLSEGAELIDSIGRATGTAGSAVVVAGLTVVAALAALTLTGIPFLGVMGLAAAATVGVAVVVSITLTPALLRFIGPRILSRSGRRRRADALTSTGEGARQSVVADATTSAGRAKGWGARVTRHPMIALGASVAALAVLAIPAMSLQLGLPDGGFEAQDSTAYRAYSLVTDRFGAGENATMIGVAKVPAAKAAKLSKDALADLKLDIAERLKSIPGVSYVVPATASKDHQTLVFQIVPETGPSDEATSAVVNALRAERAAIIADTGITSLGLAGQTVANIDISDLLAGALPGYLTVVVGISVVLLLLVFRSLVVPLLATAGFLLSIAASFGGVVAVYQWGWFGSVFGVEHAGVILSFLPTLAIGILFGLAMDYQMFLVSGMREAWAHGEDPRTAVRTGFSHGAKVITAAALIMTSVFSSFMHSEMTMIRPIGFVLAFGVLIDAFVVRMTIMPALMHLLGAKAWYLPKWLDRILPDLDIEGTKLAGALGHPLPQRHPEGPAGSPLPVPA